MSTVIGHLRIVFIFRKMIGIGIVFFFFVFLLGAAQDEPVNAASLTNWKAGRIIDDSVFTNSNTMNTPSIQAFLNSKVSSCDTYGKKVSEYGGGTRAQWGQKNYGQSTFTCLKDYSEGGKTAAEIIYSASQEFTINPQVLIVLLQKEQGLVTDEWPLNIQYRSATGYGCPDTTVCDSQYYGFTNQVRWAARMFRAIMNNSQTWYTPYVLGDNYIRYNPDVSCGGATVNIMNRATQALYNYTPYQPNQAALTTSYGLGDTCSSYGNRNFYEYFTDWFGSTYVPDYDYSFVSSSQAILDLDYSQSSQGTIVIKNTGSATWYADGNTPGAFGAVRLSLKNYEPTAFADRWLDVNWLGTANQIKMSPSAVSPGENATFTFKLRGPNRNTGQTLNFVPVVDGVGFMRNINMQFILRSSPPKYSFVSSSFAPTSLTPGQKFTANLVLKNTGFGPWYADGSGANQPAIRLAALNYSSNPFADPTDENWLGTRNQIKMSPSIVGVGENAQFSFNLIGPNQKTSYFFRFLPVLDGVAFLDDYGMAFSLSSPGRVYSYDFVAVTPPPSIMNSGQVVSTTLRLRNSGNITWKNESTRDSSNPSIRLVMSRPYYRSSVFYDASDNRWITDGQVSMLESEVAPGETGTFSFNWRAPQTKGVFVEHFAPVADGVMLLDDKLMGYVVTVK